MKKSFAISSGKKSLLSKKWLITAVVVALVILGASTYALDKTGVLDIPFIGNDGTSQTHSNVNYDPPTDQEKQETEEFKKDQSENSSNAPAPTPTPGKKTPVSVVMTSWGQNSQTKAIEANGYMSGVLEGGGICTLTLKKSATVVTESHSATVNAQNVSCGQISIAYSRLTLGAWEMTLSYNSSTAEGTSSVAVYEVQ